MENIQILKAEKQELQKKHDYYTSMRNWYRENIDDILTTVKQQIDRIDSKLLNQQKQTV
ncbi:MAG: hypothetical protein ACOCPM_07190 [Bacteroidales bacterium]